MLAGPNAPNLVLVGAPEPGGGRRTLALPRGLHRQQLPVQLPLVGAAAHVGGAAGAGRRRGLAAREPAAQWPLQRPARRSSGG